MTEPLKRALGASARLLVMLATACVAFAQAASAEEPAPRLVLDTGGHMALVRNIDFTADGTHLISASDDKEIRIWNVETGQTERVIRGEIADGEDGKLLALALSPDGKTLAVGGKLAGLNGGSGAIRIIDLKSGEVTHLLEGHADGVLSLTFSPDSRLLASGSMDDTAMVWSTADYTLARRIEGHHGDINAVRFTRDGKRLVTASDDTALGLWDLEDGHLIAQLSGHTDVAISVESVGKAYRIWEAPSARLTAPVLEAVASGLPASAAGETFG